MKLGIHSLLFSETFLQKDLFRLEQFRRMGFDAVEIIPFDLDGFPAAEVRRVAADLGLEINTGYGMPSTHNAISPDPQVRRAAADLGRKLVDASVTAGAKVLGGVTYCGWGYLTGSMPTEDEWKWGVDNYRDIAEHAHRSDPALVLAVEPINRFESHFINTASDALRFIEAVGTPNLRVHLDTFHMIREEDDFCEPVRQLGRKLGYVHACENQRGIPGRGQVPWTAFFRALAEVNYDGCVTIESFDPNMTEIAKLCCIWRKLADSPEQLATEGLAFLRNVEATVHAKTDA